MTKIFFFIYCSVMTFSLNSNANGLANYCKERNWHEVQKLIGRSEVTDISSRAKALCAREAFCAGKTDFFTLFLSLNNDRLPTISKTCLYQAIVNGTPYHLSLAKDKGLKFPDEINGDPTIFIAQKNSHAEEMTQYIITKIGIQKINNNSFSSGRTALHEAIVRGNIKAIKLLFKYGADLVLSLYEEKRSGEHEAVLNPSSSDKIIAGLWFSLNLNIDNILKSDNYSVREKYILLQFLLRATKDHIHENLELTFKKFEKMQLEFLINEEQRSPQIIDAPQPQEDKRFCFLECEEQEYYRLSVCGHEVCKDCATEYFSQQLKELKAPFCPVHLCQKPLSNEDCHAFEIPEEYILRSSIKELSEKIKRTQKFYQCPKPDCRGGNIKKEKFVFGSSHVTCIVCGTCSCLTCHESHPRFSCKKAESLERKEVIKLVSEKAKACPKCKVIIVKNLGCDHMTCANCRYEFYWTSGRRYRKK